jgi:RNA recognition motif-containing protein
MRRLFVANMNPLSTDDDLYKHFIQFGLLESAFVVKDFKTQKSLSYGYVIFKELEDMERALNTPGHVLQGRELVLERFLGKQGKNRRNKSDTQALSHKSHNSGF